MPSTATVDAHILENHDASVEINRRFGSKTSLALPTSHDAFFTHTPKSMLERMDGLLVKTTVSLVHTCAFFPPPPYILAHQAQPCDDPTDFTSP